MKALIIASVLFFGLKAMSAEVGEASKSECASINQTAKREAKIVIEDPSSSAKNTESQTRSK